MADVRKELNFCKKVGIPVLGVVENMSGFVCPHCEVSTIGSQIHIIVSHYGIDFQLISNCQECTNLFSTGGGEAMAEEFGVSFLGA